MGRQETRYYRKITETVLRWYNELDGGIVQTDTGPVFDTRVVDYRMDVDRILDRLAEQERAMLMLIHRDGCTHAEAAQGVGISAQRPDVLVEEIETRIGRVFDRYRLDDFLRYVGYLR